MARTVTDKLLEDLNRVRGLEYKDIGYSYYADIKGDGSNHKSIWEIRNVNGGVGYSSLNGKNSRETCKNIRFKLLNKGIDELKESVTFNV